MRMRGRAKAIFLASAFLFTAPGWAQTADILKDIQTRISWYRSWLDQAGSSGSRFWLRLDSSKRPHRLFVGENFLLAESDAQEEFVEIFSRYLAGHPDKNMLIDIYSAESGKLIGEYGFGGFRMFQTNGSAQPPLP
jgi:hypothetical protein